MLAIIVLVYLTIAVALLNVFWIATGDTEWWVDLLLGLFWPILVVAFIIATIQDRKLTKQMRKHDL